MKHFISFSACLLALTLFPYLRCGDEPSTNAAPSSNNPSQIAFTHSIDITDEEFKIEEIYKNIKEVVEDEPAKRPDSPTVKKTTACLKCLCTIL